MSPSRYVSEARREINRLRRDLNELFERAHRLDEADELTADISRYICVRLSGYLEQSLAFCGRSLCAQKSWGEGLHFTLSWLKKTPNPRSDEIIKFVQRFSEAWAAELAQLLAEEERGQSVNALLGIRNDVAHGKSQGVSRERALEYYAVADRIVDFLLDRFEPIPRPASGRT